MRIKNKTTIFKKYYWVLPILAFSILVFLGSLMHPLWTDEAETALFAKNILTLLLILFSYPYISASQKKSIQQFASFTLKSGCIKADFL